MDMAVIISTMLKLFITLVLGFYLNKKNIIDKATSTKLSAFIVKVTCPALVISSVLGDKMSGNKSEVFFVFLIGIGLYALLPILSYLLTRILHIKKQNMGIYQFMFIFANTSFMGYPIVESMFGKSAIFYSSILHMPFNILVFSYGIYLVSKDNEEQAKFNPKVLINTGILASLLALIIYFLELNIPDNISETISFIGDMTPALSMIVLGASLAQYSLKDMLTDKKIYIMSVIRLIILPVVGYYFISSLTTNHMIIGIVTITLGLPVASMSVMLSSEYRGPVKTASMGVFITTIASIITIPLIAYLFLR